MPWTDLDPTIIEEWERRKARHLQHSRPLRIAVLASGLFAAGCVVYAGLGFFPIALMIWSVVLAIFAGIEMVLIRQELTCPGCGKVPFVYGGRIVESTNPRRCIHCSRRLR
jgi:hypothetical protein